MSKTKVNVPNDLKEAIKGIDMEEGEVLHLLENAAERAYTEIEKQKRIDTYSKKVFLPMPTQPRIHPDHRLRCMWDIKQEYRHLAPSWRTGNE